MTIPRIPTLYSVLLLVLGLAVFSRASYAQWSSSGDDIYCSTCNVGIGTDDPRADLDVRGTLRVASSNDSTMIRYPSHNLYIQNEGWAHQNVRFRPDLDAQGRSLNSTLHMYSSQDQTYTEKVRISAKWHSFFNGGNVGIGTTSPSAKLEVNGSIKSERSTSDATIWSVANGDHNARLFLRRINGQSFNNRQWSFSLFAGGELTVWDHTAGRAVWKYRTDGNVEAKNGLLAGGNVGIGTTNSGAFKLAVNGEIRAKEIIVDTDWSDFVFEEGYDLPTLEEVAAHIEQHGHLPAMPSAKEVDEHGVTVGAMQATLLQKIEELTLYAIEQQNLIMEQQTQNEKLRSKVIQQQAHLAEQQAQNEDLQQHLVRLEARLAALEQQ